MRLWSWLTTRWWHTRCAWLEWRLFRVIGQGDPQRGRHILTDTLRQTERTES